MNGTAFGLNLNPEGRKTFSPEDYLSLWLYVSPSIPYQEIFLWAETPFGKYCYSPEEIWVACDKSLEGIESSLFSREYLAFQGFLTIPGRSKSIFQGIKSLTAFRKIRET